MVRVIRLVRVGIQVAVTIYRIYRTLFNDLSHLDDLPTLDPIGNLEFQRWVFEEARRMGVIR